MSSTKKPLRNRTLAVVGGVTLMGVTGAGMASGAGAATSSASATSTLAKIKYCESGGNYQAVNSSSGASGAYQFLNSTWKGLSASAGYATAASAPASVQDAAALELYQQAGTSPWAASSSCWSSMTTTPTTSSSSTSSTSSTSTSTSTASTTSTSSTAAAATTSGSAAKAKPAAKPAPKKAPAAHEAGHPAPKAPAKGAKPAAKQAPKPHGKDAHKPVGSVTKLTSGKHAAKQDCPKPAAKAVNTFKAAA